MIKTYDYKCRACEKVEERFVKAEEADRQFCRCGGDMDRLPAATPTFYRFNDRKLKKYYGPKDLSLKG